MKENENGEEMHIEFEIGSGDLALNSNTMEDYNLTVNGQNVM